MDVKRKKSRLHVLVSESFERGEFNETIAYGVATAAIMGAVGWLGIKSYNMEKWQTNQ